MADKVARALNLVGGDRDLLDSADINALLDLIDEYLEDSEGIDPPVTQPFDYTACHNNTKQAIHYTYLSYYYCYIDLDSSSTAPPSSDPPAEEEHLSLDPPDDDPPAEDDDDKEELEAQPTAAGWSCLGPAG